MSRLNDHSSPVHVRGDVLAVDDQPENLALVEEILRDEGFEVRVAADGQEALDAVSEQIPDCILLDIMMPRIDGFGVLEQLKGRRETHLIPTLMLTALTGVRDKVRAYELGADDFVNKPVSIPELVARVRSLVRIKRLRDELDTSESIIVSMIEALESKDPLAAGHSQRVAAAAVRLSQHLGLPGDAQERIAKGAVLHDIGKIGLPVELLQRANNLSADEYSLYRSHPVLGEHILAPFQSFARVKSLVRHHHERLDGTGYPDHLTDDDFDLETEIVSLANHYDGLVSHGATPDAAAAAVCQEADTGAFRTETVVALLDSMEDGDGSSVGTWHDALPVPSVNQHGEIVVASGSPHTCNVLADTLREAGHGVRCCATDQDLVRTTEQLTPDLMLLDINLPEAGGLAVSRRIKSRPETRYLPTILVTTQEQLELDAADSTATADDYLLLPINRLELTARVTSLLRLRLYFDDLEEHQSVILSLASALEAKDPYTRGHSERVGLLAMKLGRRLGLDDESCRLLRFAGQLHDIGKIGMPGDLLNKRGRLDEDELETIRRHPLIGERICRPLRTMRGVLPLVRHHHERLDGSGYPDGLAGEDLPIGARILGLADAYDALTSARSYRKTYPPARAIELLQAEAVAGCWDAKVFAALLSVVKRRTTA
jgi:putative two-component system response regulator